MSNDEKVLDFPRVEVTSEENVRRVMVEATRLASLAPGEWRLWIDRSAERLGISQDLIAAIIKDDEYRLYLRPVVLGRGKPFFAGPRPPLRLVANDLIGEGTIRLTYVPA